MATSRSSLEITRKVTLQVVVSIEIFSTKLRLGMLGSAGKPVKDVV
jgi:hypothetical protein